MLDAPLTFTPVLVPKPWGGDRMARYGRAVPSGARIGESWDLADLPEDATDVPDPVSRVASGPAAGRTLGELIALDPVGLLGGVAPTASGRFPLLVKLLDAREHLSVQVHPPRELGSGDSKTESWVVLAADEGAELLLGVRPEASLQAVLDATGTASLLPLLARAPVKAGDVVHLPAGTIHALGAGVLVAEVQTTSDATYRVWDWPDARGGGRELHVDAAREAITAGWPHNRDVVVRRAHDGVLVDDDCYRLWRTTLVAGEVLTRPQDDAPVVLVVTDGTVNWSGPDRDHRLVAGGVALLPARCTTLVTAGADGATVITAVPR